MNVLEATSADGSTVARYVPDAAMLCGSLTIDGEETLDPRNGLDAYAQHGSTMAIPLLYPWANRLDDFGYEVAGRVVSLPNDPDRLPFDPNGLPIHGAAPALMHFTDAVAAGDRLSARLDWSGPELLALFPFAHEVALEARAERAALTVTTTVRANAGDPVPVSFGFHPYLLLPGGDRSAWTATLPESAQHLLLDERMIPTGTAEAVQSRTVDLATADFDDAYRLDQAAAPAFIARSDAQMITVELLEGFGYGQVYSPPGSTFICFEPMTAPGNALRSGDGLRVLAPGEEHRATFRLTRSAVHPADQA